MKIRVSDLSEEGLHIATFRRPEWLVNIPEMASGGAAARFASNINFDLHITRVLKEISVRGELWFSIESPCARCLKDVDLTLKPEVGLVLSPGQVSGAEQGQGENIHHETYIGDEIDISDYLRELVAMSLPVKMLCDEECEGLCAGCGVDLNFKDCSCKEDRIDSRFEALRNLKI